MPSDPSSDLILVTCASGKQAAPLLPLLSATYSRLRLVVNSESSLQRLATAYPKAEVVRADLNSYSDVRAIFRGVAVVYHVGPSLHHHETQCGYHAIDAALAERKESVGGFKHFVFSSVLNTQIRKLLNHDCKRYVEERLYESGLDYTVLKPGNFIDSFPISAMTKQERPTYHPLWDPEIPNSFVMLQDLAHVTIKVINERENHFFAEYPLVSTLPTPYTEMVKKAEKALGKKVRIEQASFENTVAALNEGFLGEDQNPLSVDVSERLILWYGRYGLNGNPNVMRFLLGREPMTIDEWMAKSLNLAHEGRST